MLEERGMQIIMNCFPTRKKRKMIKILFKRIQRFSREFGWSGIVMGT